MAAGGAAVDVAVVGGGVIGLAAAWRVAADGATVALVDPQPGRGATWAAAGMLAAVTEAEATSPALAGLSLASAARWPSWAAELSAASGVDVAPSSRGTLVVAVNDDDRRAVDDLAALHAELGLPSTRLTGREAQRLEPSLHPRLRAGLDVPDDRSIDPRRVTAALLAALDRHGVEVVARRARRVGAGEVTLEDGAALRAGTVVVAAGAAAPDLGVPPVPVRPVKGQILRLRAEPAELPGRTIRALVRGSSVYLVPRPDGGLVVGATMEELGWSDTLTAGAVHQLLHDAMEVLPGVSEMELAETTVRHRPATPDNAPVIGASSVPGVVLATGHHRNGVLLAPVTADAVADLVGGRPVPDVVAAVGPGRFA